MDALLGKVTQQAMNYAIKSGITLTATYALKQSTKLLQNAPKSSASNELYELQKRIEHKIRIVSPAIDMIELIAARGNTSLESAVSLTKELRRDIERLSVRLAKAVAASQEYRAGSQRSKLAGAAADEQEIQLITYDMKQLLLRIEDAVPLISLALTTSGAKLSTQLPSTVSPSRLLQASMFMTTGDAQYMASPHRVAQIGPTFTLCVYMLFAGYDRPESEEDVRETTWKEVIHKARVKLRRVPLDVVISTGSGSDALEAHQISTTRQTPSQNESSSQIRGETRSDEFAYQLVIVEDFDDDRHHDFEDGDAKPGPFDDVKRAGIREMIPVHEISKIFYADTSKVLNIGMDAESNHPVLLLRRDVQAVPPRRMFPGDSEDSPQANDESTKHKDDGRPQTEEEKAYVENEHKERKHDPWRLPPSLDPEWLALEVYTEASASEDSEDDEEYKEDFATPDEGVDSSQLSVSMSTLNIDSPQMATPQPPSSQAWQPQIKTSLSLLELLLRLTSLQQFQQQSHLSIPDELLNFFLEESASTGAGGNEQHRQAIRADARRRVGWDPYDESPVKHRGEEYQHHAYYGSPGVRQQYQYSHNGSMASPGPPPTHRAGTDSPGMQTRSITGTPDSQSRGTPLSPPASSYNKVTISNRPEWLKRPVDSRSGSPLRPNTMHSDEGIGTSPSDPPGTRP
ncbi:Ran-specific GTPase-activating protein 30 [Lithohypha guttulata]|nr:Ran-specific GTPase-activating protein 30 [Lithohypha guttulata]